VALDGSKNGQPIVLGRWYWPSFDFAHESQLREYADCAPQAGIEIPWQTQIDTLISTEFLSNQFRRRGYAALVQNFFISIEFLFIAIVGLPAHPLWFRRQVPFVGVKLAERA
jgi:hypothetical protein